MKSCCCCEQQPLPLCKNYKTDSYKETKISISIIMCGSRPPGWHPASRVAPNEPHLWNLYPCVFACHNKQDWTQQKSVEITVWFLRPGHKSLSFGEISPRELATVHLGKLKWCYGAIPTSEELKPPANFQHQLVSHVPCEWSSHVSGQDPPAPSKSSDDYSHGCRVIANRWENPSQHQPAKLPKNSCPIGSERDNVLLLL